MRFYAKHDDILQMPNVCKSRQSYKKVEKHLYKL